ncbi:MAG: hypothetical protein AB1742_01460 [bacterium]
MLKKLAAAFVIVTLVTMLAGGIVLTIIQRSARGEIRRITAPLPGAPVVVEKGGAFSVSLNLHPEAAVDRVYLAAVFARDDLHYVLQVVDSRTDPRKTTRRTLRVKVPPLTPRSLYDLVVVSSLRGRTSVDDQPGVVSVRDPGGGFSFLVTGRLESLTAGGMTSRARAELGKMIAEINLLNPDFAVIPGGFSGGVLKERDFRALSGALASDARVPFFLFPSPSDRGRVTIRGGLLYDNGKAWKKYFHAGPASFDVGRFHVALPDTSDCGVERDLGTFRSEGGAALCCMGAVTLSWLRSDLSGASARGRRTLVFTGCAPGAPPGDGRRERAGRFPNPFTDRAIAKLMNENGVVAVFDLIRAKDGEVTLRDGLRVVSTRGGKHPASLPGYSLVYVKNGELTGAHYVPPHGAAPFGKVRVKETRPNDGAAHDNRFVIVNGLNRRLERLRVEALMAPAPPGAYNVSGADAASWFLTPGKTHLFLTADVEKGAARTISIESVKKTKPARSAPPAKGKKRGK